jgi:hypothetical protein
MELLDKCITYHYPVQCQLQSSRLYSIPHHRCNFNLCIAGQQPIRTLKRRIHGVGGTQRESRTVGRAVELQNAELEAPTSAESNVSAVLFDMDGVLCNSEELSRK